MTQTWCNDSVSPHCVLYTEWNFSPLSIILKRNSHNITLKSSLSIACLVYGEICTSGRPHIYKRGHSFMWTQAFSKSIYIFSIDCETYKTMNTRNTSTMPFLALGIHSFLSLTVIKYIMVISQGVCLHRFHWRTNVKNNYMHDHT